MTEDRRLRPVSADDLSGEAFRAVVERTTDLTALLAADGRIRFLSDAAERVWGYQIPDQVGRHFASYIHPDDRDLVAERYALAVGMPGSTVELEFRLRRGDGTWRYVEVRTTNLLADPSVRAMAINVRDVNARIEAAKQLTWRAHHDFLTGLANRAAFIERLGAALENGRGEAPALLYIDLDGFKAVNDSYGHEAGDRLLAAIGGRLRNAVRALDCAARIGGDEFVVLVDHHPSPERVVGLATRIAASLREPVSLAPGASCPQITASIGIAFAQDRNPAHLLDDADQALYEAKRLGRGRTEVFARPA